MTVVFVGLSGDRGVVDEIFDGRSEETDHDGLERITSIEGYDLSDDDRQVWV